LAARPAALTSWSHLIDDRRRFDMERERLIGSAADQAVEAAWPSTSGYPVERLDIAARGHQILAARGIAAESASYEELALAYEQAERELARTAPRRRVAEGEVASFAVNATAEKILAERGKSIATCTEAEFMEAVATAEQRLGHTYRSVR
jgi:hypothetical protein